jgi:hypothetical protein
MIGAVLGRMFKNARYTQLAVSVGFLTFSGAVLLPNSVLIAQTVGAQGVTFTEKLSLIFSLYGSIATNFTPFSAVYTIVLSVLFGMNAALFLYYIRRAQIGTNTSTKKMTSIGLAGFASGILGIGCAACGSVILTALLASLGAAGALVYFPLHGAEFALLSILLLLASSYYLIKKINDPLVCLQ